MTPEACSRPGAPPLARQPGRITPAVTQPPNSFGPPAPAAVGLAEDDKQLLDDATTHALNDARVTKDIASVPAQTPAGHSCTRASALS